MEEEFKLSETDYRAINLNDGNHFTNKGANLYNEDTFYKSVEYYRLGAALGEIHAISDLGYCYLYGRDIEQNTSIAIAYFMIAGNKGDIDALYKLGDIYGNDKWGVKDIELSIYYYNKAAEILLSDNNAPGIVHRSDLQRFPSLCFALGREFSIDGHMPCDLDLSYQFLKHAEYGYKTALNNGDTFYKDVYNNLLEFIDRDCYDNIREHYNDEFYELYDSDVYEEDE